MLPIEEVRAAVFDRMPLLGHEPVPFGQALGRVLAEDVVAPHDVPHFANSAMDGFAVRGSDVSSAGAVLEILEDVPAGQVASRAVGPGQAIRIMTGAPMPEGADTVVRVEDTSVDDGKVIVSTEVAPGTYLRPAGGDVRGGSVVYEAGVRLGPMHLGVLATLGVVQPVVSRRPRVAVMSTGDELMPPDTVELAPGMIRDSNRPMLAALVGEMGAEIIDLGRVPDDPDALRAAVGRAAVEADVIITSGGVSMGDYDVTKLVLRDEVGIDFMQVAMKPGKPFAFGLIAGTPFFGLPGNPVSVMVSFETFVRPALLTMQGARAIYRPLAHGFAGETMMTDPEKEVFIRVWIRDEGGRWVADLTGGQDSNVLSGAAEADALAIVPRGVETIESGEPVDLLLIRSPETRGRDDV